jgi:prepilin-type N-terminal cleavage/methylation domain-containing protein
MIHQHKRRRRARLGAATAGRGFTMVEVLVVIVVIALLVGISLTVAVRAVSSGKVRATENILKTVDQVITEFGSTAGKIPAFHTDQFGVAYPMVDGVRVTGAGVGGPLQPSLSLFLAEAAKLRLTDRMLQSIDSQFIVRTPVPAIGFDVTGLPFPNFIDGLVVLDGFGHPLRLVHPAFHGGYGKFYKLGAGGDFDEDGGARPNLSVKGPATIFSAGNGAAIEFRRSCLPDPFIYGDNAAQGFGDADEGMCIANRPYLYSCGIDGNPGTRIDNIYVNGKPQFPAETATIFAIDP